MSSALVQRFRLDDTSWVRDPRTEAGKLVHDVVVVGELLAEAQEELAIAKVEAQAWEATAQMAVLAKKPKWPKWRIDSEVYSDPKHRAHGRRVAEAASTVTKLNAIALALRRKAWFIGVLYNIEEVLAVAGAEAPDL